MREELNTWLKYFALLSAGSMSAIRFEIVMPLGGTIIVSILFVFWFGTAAVLISRLAGKDRKRSGGKQ